MASIWQLEQSMSNYKNLKSTLNNFLNSLVEARDDVSQINPVLEKNYSINDSGNNGKVRVKKLEDNITKEIDFIRGTVIPAIDSKCTEITRQIEEERRRQEEERQRMLQAMQQRSVRTYTTRWWM